VYPGNRVIPVCQQRHLSRCQRPRRAVSYSVRLHDIASFDFPGFNPVGYEQQMIGEFD
jgi:hypothetical protein